MLIIPTGVSGVAILPSPPPDKGTTLYLNLSVVALFSNTNWVFKCVVGGDADATNGFA